MLREDDASFYSLLGPRTGHVPNHVAARETRASMLLFYHVTDIDDADRIFELEITPRTRIMGEPSENSDHARNSRDSTTRR
jgi:hypothetical protein